MTKIWLIGASVLAIPLFNSAQTSDLNPPVIDVHMHAPVSSGPSRSVGR
jgi:hypothetical protein